MELIRLIRRIVPVVALTTAMAACTGVPDDVLDKEEMAQLLADVHTGEAVVEANISAFPTDSVKRAFKQSIFKKHGLTTAQVDRSLRWYGNHMDKYVEVYDRVLEIINEDMETARQQAGVTGGDAIQSGSSLALEGDSVDVWNDVRFRPFADNLPSDYLPFLLTYDMNWERGDVYTLRSKLIGNSHPARFSVAVDYSDGSTETFSQSMIGEGWHEVGFALDSARTAREIYGAVWYDAPGQEKAYIDSVTLTRTRWNTGRKPLRVNMRRTYSKRYSGKFD